MPTVSLDESSPKAIPEKYISKARQILQKVENGTANVTPITDVSAL